MSDSHSIQDANWSLADVVDFEMLLHEDKGQAEKPLDTRDRKIFVEAIRPQLKEDETRSPPRSGLFRCWLEARRKGRSATGNELLPGDAVDSATGVVSTLLFLFGLLVGLVVASSLLRYQTGQAGQVGAGNPAVNVSWYLWILVGVQVALAVLGLLGVLSLRFNLLPEGLRNLFTGMSGVVRRVWLWAAGKFRIEASQRESYRRYAGLAQARGSIYGSVLTTRSLRLVQVFGVAFNLAALLTTFLILLGSNRSFGWESTVIEKSDNVHAVVKTMAAPWSWIWGEGEGYPSLKQVEDSRISAYKADVNEVEADARRSWWRFLLLAVFTYGLLPRLILYGLTSLTLRRNLKNLKFNHADCQRLYDRMITPELSMSVTSQPTKTPRKGLPAYEPSANKTPSNASNEPAGSAPTSTNSKPAKGRASKGTASRGNAASGIAADALVLIVTADIEDLLPESNLAERVQAQLGRSVAAYYCLDANDEEILTDVAKLSWVSPPGRILIACEGWQPVIAEFRDFVLELRAAAGKDCLIQWLLVGLPAGGEIRSVSESQVKHWQAQLDALADPYLSLIQLEATS